MSKINRIEFAGYNFELSIEIDVDLEEIMNSFNIDNHPDPVDPYQVYVLLWVLTKELEKIAEDKNENN